MLAAVRGVTDRSSPGPLRVVNDLWAARRGSEPRLEDTTVKVPFTILQTTAIGGNGRGVDAG